MAKKTEKRAPKGDGSVFKSADGRWWSYITVGINPETGKPKRRYFSGQTKEEVRKKKAQALADLEHDTYQEPNRITVKAWLDKWMEVLSSPPGHNTPITAMIQRSGRIFSRISAVCASRTFARLTFSRFSTE